MRRLCGPQVQELAAEVPVVERLAGLQTFVALQSVDRPAGDLGQGVGERGLADTGLALEEQRPVHRQRQVGGGRQPLVGQVPGGLQGGGERGRVGGEGRRVRSLTRCSIPPPGAGTARSRMRQCLPAAFPRPSPTDDRADAADDAAHELALGDDLRAFVDASPSRPTPSPSWPGA